MRETECSYYEPADGDCLTNACGGCCVKYRAELDNLRAEVERLRKALGYITDISEANAGRAIVEMKRIALGQLRRLAKCRQGNARHSVRAEVLRQGAGDFALELFQHGRKVVFLGNLAASSGLECIGVGAHGFLT